tara:strand:+ start:2854 stop:5334 length:2481 start_codon:yes stop_codon:yes gene_type:complete
VVDQQTENISILDIPPEKLTPGMKQYQDAKRAHPDCVVMLRMGDFFEMFYEDAITAANELEITLTARGKGEKRAPLAGVPHHALDQYLAKFVKRGYKVALVEQLEDPKKAKGLVKRGVVRVVTPGTVIEGSLLNEQENNYLMSLSCSGDMAAIALCDMSTGEFFTSIINEQTVLQEIHRYSPSECIIPESLLVNEQLVSQIRLISFVTSVDDYFFSTEKAGSVIDNHFEQSVPLTDPRNISVSGALLNYLLQTQKNTLPHLKTITLKNNHSAMILDASTFRNLELLRNLTDNTQRGTLLSVVDKTSTSAGARLLKKWMKEPLVDKIRIKNRLEAVEMLNNNVILRAELTTILKQVLDIERLIGRLNYGSANARDLLALRQSLQQIPIITERLSRLPGALLSSITTCPQLIEVTELIRKSVKEDPPLTIREGGIIRPDYDYNLKELHEIKSNSKRFLQQLEEEERKKTGISTLRIAYNRVFGYFFEITKKNIHLVPEHYIRKQTTANSERYITEELKIEEEKILGTQEKIQELEYRLFQELVENITTQTSDIQLAAHKLSVLDVLCSFATVAMENNYIRPEFNNDFSLHIENGRHPVIEQQTSFIGNDIYVHSGEMMIITGPNMSGKSSLMRQVALIVLMAQMGSFVPADKAVLSITDRIFTRVGAQDDLSSGQSTFMVEMNETASILHNATENSLVILDEIGRGTSTFDGVSIAWSVAEHIHNKIKAKTLFSTHYHVMNKLAEKFSKIKNYNLAVREVGNEVVFLYKLIEGGTDQSYGVHVARLAGLPLEVIERAKEIQSILEKDDDMVNRIKAKKLESQKGLGEY